MSIVIIGGHDRMVCRYKNICKEFNCEAKVYTQPSGNLESKIGRPNCIILFTNPISHKMAIIARNTAAQNNIPLVQSHNGSVSALRNILGEQLEAGM